jgi:xylulose-5-phosphate/fructose-6-phosphate phosphoketolase
MTDFAVKASETTWRNGLASINYIETSTWTRQEHNGFSHQNPSFVGAVLNLKAAVARVYFPPDANTFMSTVDHCLRSKGYVNLVVGSKQPSPVYFTPEEAEMHCRHGGGILNFASTDNGTNPDVVLVGIGTELTFEVIKAALLLCKRIPDIRLRTINVTDIMILSAPPNPHPHALDEKDYASLFVPDVAIHFNYHGYAQEIKGVLFGRPHKSITIGSYIEEGTTTTPFDMMLVNEVSRYHVAKAAVCGAAKRNEQVRLRQHELLSELDQDIRQAKEYIFKNGVDPDGTYSVHEVPAQ